MRCIANDQTTGRVHRFDAADPMDAINQTMEWALLSWNEQPQRAQVFQVHIHNTPRAGWSVTLHAMYDGNRQTYTINMRTGA